MNYTLVELLKEQIIVIPQIQRDYAQGRTDKIELRIDFLKKIKNCLTIGNPILNLDFVYGYTDVIDKDITFFKPIDGQQRLTTLWLIHWYVAPKSIEEVNIKNKVFLSKTLMPEAIELLENFSYETRPSSKRFCKFLVSQPLVKSKDKISDSIKDAAWFMDSWKNDPTIISMLNMLDDIETVKTEDNLKFSEEDWSILISERKLTFDYIDIRSEEFKLTDELYIKMNSRGKPLTIFENFKAQFSDLLSSKDTNFYQKTKIYDNIEVTYQEYFAFKIDNDWMDLFWNHRQEIDKFNNEKNLQDKISIDDTIVNFIFYIAEFEYFKSKSDENEEFVKNFDSLKVIFKDKENIDFLFDSLDTLKSLKNSEEFFNEIFCNNIYIENRIKLFDDKTTNLFFRSITDINFDVRHKVLLYSILLYATKAKCTDVNIRLINTLRVIRNLLLRVRQVNTSLRTEYTTNLRIANLKKYSDFSDEFIQSVVNHQDKGVYEILLNGNYKGFDSELINSEKVKARFIMENKNIESCFHKLEEHNYLQGITDIFELKAENFEAKAIAFREIWNLNVDTSLLIRSLLVFGDFSVCTHENTSLGKAMYFGTNGGWNRILTTPQTNEQEKIKTVIDKFLEAYINERSNNVEVKLNKIIKQFSTPDLKDWMYYFVKYPGMISSDRLNLFSWKENGFEIHSLGNSGKQPLSSYHYSPYICALLYALNDDKNSNWYWGRHSESFSYVKLCDRFNVYSTKEGWLITTEKRKSISDSIVEKHKIIVNDDGNWELVCKKNKDRIKLAKELCEDIILEFK
jgi:hypothetical protein